MFFYKEKNKDIQAAAYLRLSIEDGDKAESNSIGNQRELIRDFAAERPGLHLVEEYADDGYTGTNFERPGFKRMMEDIKSGKINCIIVKDLSRLGRNYIEMGKYLEQIFPMMGILLLAARFHAAAAVCVCDIQPKCPVVFEYPAQLPEHFHKPPDILLRRVLTSNLRVKPVVP